MVARKRAAWFLLLAIFALNACGPEDEKAEPDIEGGLSETGQNPVLSISVPLTKKKTGVGSPEIRRIDQLSSDVTAKEEQVDMLNAMVLEGDGETALPLLLDALQSNDAEVRLTAILGLREFAAKPEVVESLIEALDDPDNLVVIEAIETLEEAGDVQAIDKLTELSLYHDDEMVRELAKLLVEQLSNY